LYTGFDNVIANSPANVENKGWEFTLNAKVFERSNISWTLNFNTGKNKNKLLSYPNLDQSPYNYYYVVGQPLNIVRALHYTGVDPQTGQYQYEDKHKDGQISTSLDSLDDRYVLEINPKFTGGLGTNFRFKEFQISLNFYFVKQKGTNALNTPSSIPGSPYNTSLYVFNNRWQKPGDIATVAKFTNNPDQSYTNFYQSDGIYTDASFIRLTNLSLSYSLPSKIISKARLQGVQIRVSAQNILTITKYKGLDPETQNFGGMPPAKIITGGITFNL
jgi:hypothetical protein